MSSHTSPGDLKSFPHDIQAFIRGYPNQGTSSSSTSSHLNLDFYNDKIPMRPDNVTISQVHSSWFGQYDTLESRHGFIQWLFPIREHGVNPQASPLTAYEVSQITDTMRNRMRKSLDLMLDFYGMQIVDGETLQLGRTDRYRDRYENLLTSTHNYLRISRILKSLSEFGLERYNVPILLFFLVEHGKRELNTRGLSSSLDNYWARCIRNNEARDFLAALIVDVRGGKPLTQNEYQRILSHKLETGKWLRSDPSNESSDTKL
ncbi:protein of unknown function [Taphrina deformans PYCC 5710]|uniref:Opioid growth factor receptor (OGFr) conserved domain-containing protein n=1 Tax=Taphrina deformans (strain PYCC 5710 / ATCC 11124 / CBS 356.35 / IMI 108563 / JCM 9778 / NBRC 8474) TaxID=1097556 RepID=R4XG56_TAPDE|nr:protein of unknown function [Taphrina deformans PYCC 5710]|eukprot:CCG84637.1 protein of unknown function [Taphrina deformans PYCC 5710]